MALPKYRPERPKPARMRHYRKRLRRNLAFTPVEPGQIASAYRVERCGGLGTAMACADHSGVMAIAGSQVPIYQPGIYTEEELYCWVCDAKLLWIEQDLINRPYRAA